MADEEARMRAQVDAAMRQVRKVLHDARDPQLATDVHHEYADKFFLAEFMTSAAAASMFSALEYLGCTEALLGTAKQWSKEKRVTLAFHVDESCIFKKKAVREVESSTRRVSVSGSVSGSVSRKSVTKVTEYIWTHTTQYDVVLYHGVDTPGTRQALLERSFTQEKITLDETPPVPKVMHPPRAVDVTWLLGVLSDGLELAFRVDRAHAECHTPARNPEVERAVAAAREMRAWAEGVAECLACKSRTDRGAAAAACDVDGVLVPVLPLLEHLEAAAEPTAAGRVGAVALRTSAAEGNVAPATVLPLADLEAFLLEERRAMDEHHHKLLAFKSDAATAAVHGPTLCTLAVLTHIAHVLTTYTDAIAFIEAMLRAQLAAAIGKTVTSADFTEYMAFHNRKLFRAPYAPTGFCYSVRRPRHNPEGVVSIEERRKAGAAALPLTTITRCLPETDAPMRFALNASAEVRFTGKRYVHAYVGHQFSTEATPELELVATARQFSAYVVVLGHIGGRDLFLPKHAVLLENKDDLRVPLELTPIPSKQEFDDAIHSLSPAQQRFAKAYRSMQLEATLFGMCVIQVKPQLEAVLGLPANSLTKEIELTQRVMELFVKYHLASDLFSWRPAACEDPDDVDVDDKIDAVRARVDALYEMLDACKDEELADAAREAMVAELQEEPSWGGVWDEEDKKKEKKKKKPEKRERIMNKSRSAATGASAQSSPAQQQQQQQQQQEQQVTIDHSVHVDQEAPEASGVGFDITALPAAIERRCEEYDVEGCLRPTIINTGDAWKKTHQSGLLSKPETTTLRAVEMAAEKTKAFDLLDALTRSGLLPLSGVDVHVVVASTHCFDRTLVDTVIQRSVNPVEKVERSVLIVASAIHEAAAAELVEDGQVARLREFSPRLMCP